jgi:uncharacterized protein (TIGR03437 family)
VSKFDASGKLRFTVLLGGVILTETLAFDGGGNIYVTGEATAGLPTTPDVYRPALPPYTGPPLPVTGFWRGPFTCKLRASDGAPVYCTYLDVAPQGTVADAAGALYLAREERRETTVTKLDPKGTQMLYRIRIPGSGYLSSLVVDRAGGVFLAGWATSPDFVFNPAAPPPGPLGAPFLAKVDPSGSNLAFARRVEAPDSFVSPPVTIPQLAVDREGAVYAAGPADGQSAFIRKYDGSTSAIIYDARFPLSVIAGLYSLAVDETGVATLAGMTTGARLPLYRNGGTCTGEAGRPSNRGAFLLRANSSGRLLQTSWIGAETIRLLVLTEDGAWAAGGILPPAGSASPPVWGRLQVFRFGAGAGLVEKRLGCIANAATGWVSPVSPGGIVSLFGQTIGPAIPALGRPGPDNRYPMTLADYSVTFNGQAAPLLYAADDQINAIAPWTLGGGPAAEVCVKRRGEEVGCLTAGVSAAIPGIFESAPGVAAAVNQDGTINSAENPAAPGTVVSLYGTGLGPLSPAPRDGAVLEPPLPELQSSVRVLTPVPENRRYPMPAEVLYAGPAPYAVAGLIQVNFRVPPTAVPGVLRVTLEACSPRPCTGPVSPALSSVYVGETR